MKVTINHNAVGNNATYGGDKATYGDDGDVIGIRPIIPNTFGKCDICKNYESNKTACLAGAVSPMVCGPLYQPLAASEAADDENNAPGQIGENPAVIKSQCLNILNGSAPAESKVRAMGHLFKSAGVMDPRVWAGLMPQALSIGIGHEMRNAMIEAGIDEMTAGSIYYGRVGLEKSLDGKEYAVETTRPRILAEKAGNLAKAMGDYAAALDSKDATTGLVSRMMAAYTESLAAGWALESGDRTGYDKHMIKADQHATTALILSKTDKDTLGIFDLDKPFHNCLAKSREAGKYHPGDTRVSSYFHPSRLRKSEETEDLVGLAYLGGDTAKMIKSFIDSNADRIVAIALQQEEPPSVDSVAGVLFKSVNQATVKRPAIRSAMARLGIGFEYMKHRVSESMTAERA